MLQRIARLAVLPRHHGTAGDISMRAESRDVDGSHPPQMRQKKGVQMFNPLRSIYLVATVAVLGATAQPVAAETVADCYNKVLTRCAAAMEDARWYEKVAVGVFCSAMLAGCNTTISV
jgi:hypothetical protein